MTVRRRHRASLCRPPQGGHGRPRRGAERGAHPGASAPARPNSHSPCPPPPGPPRLPPPGSRPLASLKPAAPPQALPVPACPQSPVRPRTLLWRTTRPLMLGCGPHSRTPASAGQAHSLPCLRSKSLPASPGPTPPLEPPAHARHLRAHMCEVTGRLCDVIEHLSV